MSNKTLGIDLGTNSLGFCLRNPDNGKDLLKQEEFYGVTIFKSGVGRDDKGEFSYAAIRRENRSKRRLYQSRKYRIWATLQLLIDNGFCPMTQEELDRWKKYDKEKGYFRKYPVDALRFEQWVRLDFNGDGQPDYSSPYQLRAELIGQVLDMTVEENRYKFGRAMYHIAQRRGFKSSKGETLKNTEEGTDISDIDIADELKKSEQKKSKELSEYMSKEGCKTVGAAFAKMENEGMRVRNSIYQAVRSQYQQEVEYLCQFQGIDKNYAALYRGLVSTKKGEGTIFYKRPLRSQKGLVGKCLLEPKSRRCPVSHPDFELFRAYTFINNIKYRIDPADEWQRLDDKQREALFNEKFTRTKATFKFEDIKNWIKDNIVGVELQYNKDSKLSTINYSDNTTAAGCPVICRLKKILGDNWETTTISTNVTRTVTNKETGEIAKHQVQYNYEDLWHLCYSSDEVEELMEMIQGKTQLTETQFAQLPRLWDALQEGYATLSLKALRKILPFLKEGMLYNEAVSLAKLPEMLGDHWDADREIIIKDIRQLTRENKHLRFLYKITNTLIGRYKCDNSHPAKNDIEYLLDRQDKEAVKQCIIKEISLNSWNGMTHEEQDGLRHEIEGLYQQFFFKEENDRKYYESPKLKDEIKDYLLNKYPDIDKNVFTDLYHHSLIDKFPKQQPHNMEVDGNMMNVMQLGTPDIGAIKNPAVTRALYALRNTLNHMLAHGMIDEDTRVVVETAREMNDANHRRAIELWQKEREKENDAIAKIIKEFRPNYNDEDIEKGRLLFEQKEVGKEPSNDKKGKTTQADRQKAEQFAADMEKYKLWQQQNFICLYTGDAIPVKRLFDENFVDIEHTVPRSISFDDSMANKTVCFRDYNRNIKKNQIPSELGKYKEILKRLRPWYERRDHAEKQIEFWKGNTKTATTTDYKNHSIQQRLLWQMEFDYWDKKVKCFEIKKDELTSGFKNSQLVDTRIITKYAFHYLKSVFSNVEVQRGETTALFCKILGVQSLDERKDRSKHSHHAIDAAVLTLVPKAEKRDEMTELFYQREEAKKIEQEALYADLDKKLKAEVADIFSGYVTKLVDNIENNILINHKSKDQCLTPSRRRRRTAGVLVKGANGEVQWVQGDCIRGCLHDATFYGKIMTNDELRVVIRKPINTVVKSIIDKKCEASSFEMIVDEKLRDNLKKQIETYFANKSISKSAVADQPFYMLNKDGEPIKEDKNGKTIAPIRHVRCFSSAVKKAESLLTVKEQTNPSKFEHKRNYYAATGDNYLLLLYEGIVKGKLKREMQIVSLFDIANLKSSGLQLKSIKQLANEAAYKVSKNGGFPLKEILKKGIRVLFFETSVEEIDLHNKQDLNKRLYVLNNFNNMPEIIFRHHLEARPYNKNYASSKYTNSEIKPFLRLTSLTALNFLVEGDDFLISPTGDVTLIN